ncbi:MAG: branched-chain amino acid ABC transporter permease, partial [Myxococcota bacterium]
TTTGAVELLGARVLYNSFGAVTAGILALTSFFLLFRYTRLGVAMRATSTDQEVALALGIPVGRVFMLTWSLAGAFAALAGIFLCMFPSSLDSNLGFIALRAFPAVVVGGLTSPIGAVIAGLLLGLAEVLTQRYVEHPALGDFGHNLHSVVPYVIMILFLIIRPHGLFGQRDVERV